MTDSTRHPSSAPGADLVSVRDVQLIAHREFNRWAEARGYTPAFRQHMRKHWLAGFHEGLELGVQLAKPKRRRREGTA